MKCLMIQSVEPLRQLLKECLSLEGIRRSDKILRMIAINWEMGMVNLFANEDMTDDDAADVIVASAAIPGFFSAIHVRGNRRLMGVW